MEKVRVLQNQYYGYIDTVQRMLFTQKQVGMQPVQSVVAVDRTAAHLKESAESHFRAQQLDELLLHHIDGGEDELLVCNDEPSHEITQDEEHREMEGLIAQWARKVRRDPETGIVFVCPLERSQFWLSSLFGSRKKPNGQTGFHQGIDMAARRGTDVRAAAGGRVEYAGNAPGYGNTIVIVHDEVYKTRYAHLDEIQVRTNQTVAQGDRIGAVGDTGFTIKRGSDASHLHFELYERGKQINPLALVSL